MKVLNDKKSFEPSLVELNLKESNLGTKQVYIKQKVKTEKAKKLTQAEKKINPKLKKKK